MAQISREAIKTTFQAGDIPSEGDYANLIDSFAALTNDHNSGSLILSGTLDILGNVTASANVSASGIIISNISSGDVGSSGTGGIILYNSITASNADISGSSEIVATTFKAGENTQNYFEKGAFQIGKTHSDGQVSNVIFQSHGIGGQGEEFSDAYLDTGHGFDIMLNKSSSAATGSFDIFHNLSLSGAPGLLTNKIFTVDYTGNVTSSGNISIAPNSGSFIGTIGTATQGTIDHDSLANFVANEYIDHATVNLTAGDGLSGGGNITANRSFAVDAAQTTITSVTNTLLKVGRGTTDTYIDFGTDDKILLKPANATSLEVETGGIDVTGAITASGDIQGANGIFTAGATITGTAAATTFKGNNTGPYQSDSILLLPQHFSTSGNGLSQIVGGALGLGGAFTTNTNPTTTYQASYVVPHDITAVSITLYGNGGNKMYVFKNSINSASTTQIVSNGGMSNSGITTSFSESITGDGLIYLTVIHQFSTTSDQFWGGTINLS